MSPDVDENVFQKLLYFYLVYYLVNETIKIHLHSIDKVWKLNVWVAYTLEPL